MLKKFFRNPIVIGAMGTIVAMLLLPPVRSAVARIAPRPVREFLAGNV